MDKNRKELIEKFQKWLDTKPRKQIIAAQCATIAEEYHMEQLELYGVSKRTLKRICEHKDCNKEFTVELNLYADKSKANVAMMDCPHCDKRNDLWLELS